MRPSTAASILVLALPTVSGCAPCDDDAVCVIGEELPGGLLNVNAVAPDDVWLVGSSPDPVIAAGERPGPAALHWDGVRWTAAATSAWDGVELWAVWASPEQAVFVGTGGTILELEVGTLVVTPVAGVPSDTTFFGIWGASADDLWAVGQTLSGEGPPALYRRREGLWAEWEPPILGRGEAGQIYFKVHGRSADDLWIVGSGGTALRWNGQRLVKVPTDADRDTSTEPLFTVHVHEGRTIAVGGASSGLILEWDGGAWRDTSPLLLRGLNGICAGPDGVFTAVGQAGTRAHLGETGWRSDQDLEIEPVTSLDWHACDVASDGSLWTVGGRIAVRPLRQGVVAYTGPALPELIESNAQSGGG